MDGGRRLRAATGRFRMPGDIDSPGPRSSVPPGVWCLRLVLGVWGFGFGVWSLGSWGLRSGVWGLGFKIWGLGSGVWDLGFGVWGLGFGVWDLEFGIWGHGLGV